MADQIAQFSGDYEWLSNFADAVVHLDGEDYRTVEHAYQAAKTFNRTARMKIRGAGTPNSAKKMGRGVQIREDWEQVKIGTMEALLRQKFAQPDFKAKLLATGDAELVEGNWWGDVFWGVCRGVGQNQLGKLLMQTRTGRVEDK